MNPHELAITSMHQIGGGGGNRTRVRKSYISGSTYVAVSLGSHLTLPEEQGRRSASDGDS